MASDLDFRLLRMFETLARVGSFTRAAKLLNVTQSAVSHGMKRLEDQVKCPLLSRKGKTLQLTPEGRIFHTQTLRVLEAVERAAESVSGRNSEAKGVLSVAVSTSVAHFLLGPVLREFRESYPRHSVVIRLEDSHRAVAEVEEGRCDLAIAIADSQAKSLKTHALFQDRLHFVFSPLHAWSRRERIPVSEMSQEHFLLYQRHTVTFSLAEEFFLKSGVRLGSYVEIPNFEIMKQLTRIGLGVALMAPWVAEKELAEGSLIVRPLPKFSVRRHWAVMHQSARELRQAESTFIGLCKMACRAADNRWIE
jgi:LysR family transcriptional regulator, low CO2-responsive transcriptional regulator